jgi:hypothetical protein
VCCFSKVYGIEERRLTTADGCSRPVVQGKGCCVCCVRLAESITLLVHVGSNGIDADRTWHEFVFIKEGGGGRGGGEGTTTESCLGRAAGETGDVVRGNERQTSIALLSRLRHLRCTLSARYSVKRWKSVGPA